MVTQIFPRVLRVAIVQTVDEEGNVFYFQVPLANLKKSPDVGDTLVLDDLF